MMGASYTLTDAPQTASDHSPLILQMKPHQRRPSRPFRFENFWLKHKDIAFVVQRAWQPGSKILNPIRKLQRKIMATQRELRKWANETYRSRDTYLVRSKWVVQQLDHAQESRLLTSQEKNLRTKLKANIFKLAADLEERWRQRAGATWLKLGDNNTKYFHAVANGRKNLNAMTGLRSESGQLLNNNELNGELLAHYKALLGTKRTTSRVFDLTGKVGSHLATQLESLDQEITDEEIKAALFLLPKGKSSRPRRLTHIYMIEG